MEVSEINFELNFEIPSVQDENCLENLRAQISLFNQDQVVSLAQNIYNKLEPLTLQESSPFIAYKVNILLKDISAAYENSDFKMLKEACVMALLLIPIVINTTNFITKIATKGTRFLYSDLDKLIDEDNGGLVAHLVFIGINIENCSEDEKKNYFQFLMLLEAHSSLKDKPILPLLILEILNQNALTLLISLLRGEEILAESTADAIIFLRQRTDNIDDDLFINILTELTGDNEQESIYRAIKLYVLSYYTEDLGLESFNSLKEQIYSLINQSGSINTEDLAIQILEIISLFSDDHLNLIINPLEELNPELWQIIYDLQHEDDEEDEE